MHERRRLPLPEEGQKDDARYESRACVAVEMRVVNGGTGEEGCDRVVREHYSAYLCQREGKKTM